MSISQFKFTPVNMQHSVFYRLLLSPRYCLLRHVILCLLLLLFSFAEVGYNYDMNEYGPVPLVMLCITGMACKILTVYVLIRFVILRLLPKQRYAMCWYTIFSAIILFVLLQHSLETVICRHYGMACWRLSYTMSGFYYLLDFCVQVVQWLIVFMGLSMGYLLGYWTDEMQRKQMMETSQLQMETELLKEQVSPELLYETLHQSGVQALSEPLAASDRLMLLSRLLRYQLYDCRRKEVLLDSEIKFMRDYLALLERNGECFSHTLSVTGRTLGVFVPPLLFVQFVRPSNTKVKIAFNVMDEQLIFCIVGDCSRVEETKVRCRLDDICPQHYVLSVSSQNISLIIQLV